MTSPNRSAYASAVAALSAQVEALMRHPGRSSRDMPALIVAQLHLSTVAGRAGMAVQTSRSAGIEASLPAGDKDPVF